MKRSKLPHTRIKSLLPEAKEAKPAHNKELKLLEWKLTGFIKIKYWHQTNTNIHTLVKYVASTLIRGRNQSFSCRLVVISQDLSYFLHDLNEEKQNQHVACLVSGWSQWLAKVIPASLTASWICLWLQPCPPGSGGKPWVCWCDIYH